MERAEEGSREAERGRGKLEQGKLAQEGGWNANPAVRLDPKSCPCTGQT